MGTMQISDHSSAALIARFLKARGVKRVYALCGGHIMPIWMRLDTEGIQIIDVRDERAAVYMAHAEAQLTGGLGVAMVTAGPGVTNAMTGIANANVARASVLVLSGTPPPIRKTVGLCRTWCTPILFDPSPAMRKQFGNPTWCYRSSMKRCRVRWGTMGNLGRCILIFR